MLHVGQSLTKKMALATLNGKERLAICTRHHEHLASAVTKRLKKFCGAFARCFRIWHLRDRESAQTGIPTGIDAGAAETEHGLTFCTRRTHRVGKMHRSRERRDRGTMHTSVKKNSRKDTFFFLGTW